MHQPHPAPAIHHANLALGQLAPKFFGDRAEHRIGPIGRRAKNSNIFNRRNNG
jgi:hypothetical protein